MTNYQIAKDQLKCHAKQIKQFFKSDKPAVRQSINDYADALCKDSSLALSDHKKSLLHDFAASLHPKN